MKKDSVIITLVLFATCGTDPVAVPQSNKIPTITEMPPAMMGDQATTKTALGLARQNGSQLGLSVDEALRETSTLNDELGQSHTRFDRYYRGLRVFGGDFVVHQKGRAFLSFSATHTQPITLSTDPTLTANQATAVALHHFDGHAQAAEVEKIVDTRGAAPALAYHVFLRGEGRHDMPVEEHFLIDAHSGALLEKWDEFETAAAVGTGKSLYFSTVNLGTNSITGSFELRDVTRGSFYTNNMNNSTAGTGTIFTNASDVFGNSTTGDPASAGADVHFGIGATWDYYQQVHGRLGVADDGNGTLSKVHYSRNYNNAFWSTMCNCMTYGDGDGILLSSVTALDVTGHEMSHGVTAYTANLIYSGESGGINEANSDIFGTMVEFFTNNAGEPGNYFIGEKVMLQPPGWLRNMADPRADGNSIDNYSLYTVGMDVHYSSGIGNNFYYLLAESGTNRTSGIAVGPGIGRFKAQKIWYRALTVYFTTSTNYKAARAATLNAAADLYGTGSLEWTQVGNAWTATGVN